MPLLLIGMLVLQGCEAPVVLTNAEKYQIELDWCTMDWYSVVTHPFYTEGVYACMSYDDIREAKFKQCARQCENAIDDYRDVWDMEDIVSGCLTICMWE